MKQIIANRSINNTSTWALRVPFLKGGVRARHASGWSGVGEGVQEEGRVIGVGISGGRAEEAAEVRAGRYRNEKDAGVVAAAA